MALSWGLKGSIKYRSPKMWCQTAAAAYNFLAVPASLNIWLFFLIKELQLLLLNYQGWMMQGSHLHPEVCASSSLLSLGSTKTSSCFPPDSLNQHIPWEETRGSLVLSVKAGHPSRKEWSGAEDTVGSEHNLCWHIRNGQVGSTGLLHGFSQIKKTRIIKACITSPSVVGSWVEAIPSLMHWHIGYLQFWQLLPSALGVNDSEHRWKCVRARGRGGKLLPLGRQRLRVEPVPPKKSQSSDRREAHGELGDHSSASLWRNMPCPILCCLEMAN